MRHERDQRPIGFFHWHAEHERGSNWPPARGPRARPRRGPVRSFRGLATIEFPEQSIGGCDEVIVGRKVMRSKSHSAREFGHQFRPSLIGQRLERVEQCLEVFGHRIQSPTLGVSRQADEPVRRTTEIAKATGTEVAERTGNTEQRSNGGRTERQPAS